MKILCLLLLAACVSYALAKEICQSKSNGGLKPFRGKSIDVKIPCKYYALRNHQCGPYVFTVSPGNAWLDTRYKPVSVWLKINNIETGDTWYLRTGNKLALKFIKTNGKTDLFNLKKDTRSLNNKFKYKVTKNGKGGYITDENEKVFKLTFYPWDYNNKKKMRHSNFKFECLAKTSLMTNPEQMCGGEEKKKSTSIKERAKNMFKLEYSHEFHVVVYYDILNSTVEQIDEKCKEAHDIFMNNTDFETRVNVLKECSPILDKDMIVKCVNAYTCHPMYAFNACMRWGFDNFDPDSDHCAELGDYIVLCPEIKNSGNLTALLRTECNWTKYKKHMSEPL